MIRLYRKERQCFPGILHKCQKMPRKVVEIKYLWCSSAIELPILRAFHFSRNSKEELLRFAELNLSYCYSTSSMWLTAFFANLTHL